MSVALGRLWICRNTGVRDACARQRLERGLIDIGLLGCDGQDPTTSVLCSPTAGVDPAEVFDVTTLLPAIEDVLGSLGDAVDPKFGILLDGGGQIHVRCRRQALMLFARVDPQGQPCFEVRLAGALTAGQDGLRPTVRATEAAALVETVGQLSARRGSLGNWLGELRSSGASWEEQLRLQTIAVVPGNGCPETIPLGAAPQRQPGRSWVGVAPLLGRCRGETLLAMCNTLEAYTKDLRLTPWRGVLAAGIATDQTAEALRSLTECSPDLLLDSEDPASSVIACAGSQGCVSGFTDTIADAAALISDQQAATFAMRGTVHLSGCAKLCASRAPQEVTLIGNARGTYEVYRNPQRAEGLGCLVASDLTPAAARRLVVEERRTPTIPGPA